MHARAHAHLAHRVKDSSLDGLRLIRHAPRLLLAPAPQLLARPPQRRPRRTESIRELRRACTLPRALLLSRAHTRSQHLQLPATLSLPLLPCRRERLLMRACLREGLRRCELLVALGRSILGLCLGSFYQRRRRSLHSSPGEAARLCRLLKRLLRRGVRGRTRSRLGHSLGARFRCGALS